MGGQSSRPRTEQVAGHGTHHYGVTQFQPRQHGEIRPVSLAARVSAMVCLLCRFLQPSPRTSTCCSLNVLEHTGEAQMYLKRGATAARLHLGQPLLSGHA